MSLLDRLNLPDQVAVDRDYYEVLESHLEYMKKHASTRRRDFGLDEAAKYKGDFYGLLYSLGVDKKYYYPIMRVNGLSNSGEYDGLMNSIMHPSEEVLNDITTIYLSREIS